MKHNRLPNEEITDYHIRLFENSDLYELSSQDIADILNEESGKSYSESKWRKDYAQFVRWKEYLEGRNEEPSEELEKITKKKLELQKERNKLSAEKNEINKWIREAARTENIYDKIEEAIKNIEPIEVPKPKKFNFNGETQLIVDVADAHIGKEVLIKGFKGEVLAEYNKEIFKKRMWELFDATVSYIKKEEATHVTVLNHGDYVDGLLHTNQLKKQDLGVMEQVMFGAEFMVEWLNALSKYATIDYRAVTGNHAETRVLNSNRSEFREENVEILINFFIKSRLVDNKRVNVHDINHIIFFDVLGTNIMCVHGQDEKNLEKSVRDYQDIYGVKIHILKSGHLHHLNNKTIAMDGIRNVEFIQSPAICGIDDYSMNLKKTAAPGSLITVIKEGYGKINTYDIRFK